MKLSRNREKLARLRNRIGTAAWKGADLVYIEDWGWIAQGDVEMAYLVRKILRYDKHQKLNCGNFKHQCVSAFLSTLCLLFSCIEIRRKKGG